MATRAEKIRLGIFLAVSLLLLAATLLALIGPELWETRPHYSIRFRQSVSGLDEGSPVKMRGVRVGQVDKIHIAPENVEIVEVRIEVDPGTPVKKDHQAVVNFQGITGLKYIQLEGGSHRSERLPPGGEIEAGENLLTQLTGDFTDISTKIDELLTQLLVLTRPENRRRIDSILASVDRSASKLEKLITNMNQATVTAETILKENETPLNRAIVSIRTTSDHLNRTLGEFDSSLAQIRSTVEQSKVPATTREIRETTAAARAQIEQLEVQRAVTGAVQALAALERLLEATTETVGQNQESIRLAIENLRRASNNLEEITRTFQEKPVIQVFGDKPKERKLP